MSVPFFDNRRTAAFLLILQFGLLWATFFILSSAVGWPASLDDPAGVALPRLLANASAVTTGYSLYLAAALLLIPAIAAVNARFGISGAFGQITLGLAIVSAIAKTIGICRWLFAIPLLAEAAAAPDADMAQIALLFDLLNAYSGGIGEFIGVALATGIVTLLCGLAAARQSGRSGKLLGGFVALSGAGLLTTLPAAYGVELGPLLTISNIVWQFGMLALAGLALRAPDAGRS